MALTATKNLMLPATVTGSWPRPRWYNVNMWGSPLDMPAFAWQEGYAAFSVSAISREAVKHYIANQEEHHRVKSFREELVEMLNKAGVEYDPKYLD